jgi:glycosyltransferase involved in cell wall biosynthesis
MRFAAFERLATIAARLAFARAYYRGWLPLGRRAAEVLLTRGLRALWDQLADCPALTSEPRIYVPERRRRTAAKILIVSHALDNTGAPRVVCKMARALLYEGFAVRVASPSDGPLRQQLTDLGADVIVDPLLLIAPRRSLGFAANFDRIIANTALCWPVVSELGGELDIYWYFHETNIIDQTARYFPQFRPALSKAAAIWSSGLFGAERLMKYGVRARVVEFGADAASPVRPHSKAGSGNEKVTICQFAVFEPHKGQDVAVAGMRRVPAEIRAKAELHLVGRATHARFRRSVERLARGERSISFHDEVSVSEYLRRMAAADIVIVPSRNECCSSVAIDALALAKPLVCSVGAGISAYLDTGTNALITADDSPEAIARALTALIPDEALRTRLGRAGHRVYERLFSFDIFRSNLRDALALPALPGTAAEPADGRVALDLLGSA